ncbi:hypothetical protein STEG23_016986, partial [Scotinomys teguina]
LGSSSSPSQMGLLDICLSFPGPMSFIRVIYRSMDKFIGMHDILGNTISPQIDPSYPYDLTDKRNVGLLSPAQKEQHGDSGLRENHILQKETENQHLGEEHRENELRMWPPPPNKGDQNAPSDQRALTSSKKIFSFVYDYETCQLLAAPIYFREDMGIEEPADGVNFHCGK